MPQQIRDRRLFTSDAGGSPAVISIAARTTVLENNIYEVTYFESVSSTTGTLTIPTGATIRLGKLPGAADALASTITSGDPTGTSPVTAGGEVVSITSFDASGNYTLSGTPSAYPVAIIYILTITALNWSNLNIDNIMEFNAVNSYKGSFGFTVDGGSSPLLVGNFTEVELPYNCVVTDWYIHSIDGSTGADLNGSVIVDVLDSLGVSIIGTGNKPTLSSSASASAAVSGWTDTQFSDGDKLRMYLSSAALCKKIYCSFNVTKL